MKPLTEAQYALKAAVRRAVTACGGPKAAAESVRVDAARLSRYGNIDCPEFAPIDVCVEFDRAAGDNTILRALADLASQNLVPRDNAADQLAADVTALCGPLARGAGAVIADVMEARADGHLSVNEAQRLDKGLGDLEDNVVDMRAAVRKHLPRVG